MLDIYKIFLFILLTGNLTFCESDFDNAVKMAIKAAFSNQGQICLCGSRLFVQKSIYNDKSGMEIGLLFI